MSDISAEWHPVRPEGLAAALLAVTIVFSVLCTAVVLLRLWLRWTSKLVGIEDWLMGIGLVSQITSISSFPETMTSDSL